MARVVTFSKCCLFSKFSHVASKKLFCVSLLPPVRREEGDPYGRKLGWALLIFLEKFLVPVCPIIILQSSTKFFLRGRDWEFLAFQKTKHFEIRWSLFLDSLCCWQGMLQHFILVGVSYGLMAMCPEIVHFPGLDEKWQIFPLGFRPVR